MGTLQKSNTEKKMYQVSEYTFKDFAPSKDASNVREYKFLDLADNKAELAPDDVKRIKLEKNVAIQSGFAVSPLVKQYRGHNKVDNLEKEQKIQEEVERRLLAIREKAYQDGKKIGIEDGKKEVFASLIASTDEKLQRITEMVENVLSTQNDIIDHQKNEMYRLLKNLIKWITLKEISSDKDYTKRLLEKLFQEIDARNNMLIQVNAEEFEKMPEVLSYIQDKFGKMSSVRVEIDPEIKSHGLILQTENGILNATIEEQFKSLDKLFETVVNNE